MATNLVTSKHAVVIVRGINHYVRVKVSGRPQDLIGRPHVTKTDLTALWDFSCRVSLFYRLGDLLWRLPLDCQLGAQFVVRQNCFRRLRVKADRRQSVRIVRQHGLELDRSEGWGSREASHHEAHKPIVALMGYLETIFGQDFYCGSI